MRSDGRSSPRGLGRCDDANGRPRRTWRTRDRPQTGANLTGPDHPFRLHRHGTAGRSSSRHALHAGKPCAGRPLHRVGGGMSPAHPDHGISLREATRTWARIAALSFGGPAGQIAVMHRILVDEKRWISEARFLHALNYCMLLPGPEAQQLAIYIGWLMHRTRGGLIAGGLFILPGILAIMGLSYIDAAYGNVGFVEALFFGLKAAVLAIVIQALVRVGKRALRNNVMLALAAIAFIAIFFFNVPF